jgi:S-(hydroxymethyl)glutathione dehydrogenase/alcohol dehydrogenase
MELHEVELMDPGPNQVMIRLLATGLCHSDLHVLDGHSSSQFPLVLGHEGLGEVISLGEGVADFAIGDRVIPFLIPDCGACSFCRSGRTNLCVEFGARLQRGHAPFLLHGKPIKAFAGLGTFAEKTVVMADMLTKVHPAARPDHGCCIGCAVTTGLGAALITAKVTPGSSVAVFGAGGVGLSVIQGAKLAGASRIIAIDKNPAKEVVARTVGATDFLIPNEKGVVAQVQALVGAGVDFAFECVGSPVLAEQALEASHPAWGLSVCVGLMSTGSRLTAQPMSLLTGRRWTGSLMGGAKRQDVARYVDMYVAGEYDLEPVVSHRLSHNEINRGFEMMRNGESIRSVVLY